MARKRWGVWFQCLADSPVSVVLWRALQEAKTVGLGDMPIEGLAIRPVPGRKGVVECEVSAWVPIDWDAGPDPLTEEALPRAE